MQTFPDKNSTKERKLNYWIIKQSYYNVVVEEILFTVVKKLTSKELSNDSLQHL